jgi:Transcriptional regulator
MTTERYDQLAIFSAVAQERSFTRAAAKLGMSQPALSRAMRQLEDRLGVEATFSHYSQRICDASR